MNSVGSVCHSSNAAVRVDEAVFSFDDVAISGLSVGLLVPSDGVAYTIVVMEIGQIANH